MTQLKIYPEESPASPSLDTTEVGSITAELAKIGVAFERWALVDLPERADDAATLEAYAPQIERWKAAHGYQAVDVVRLQPDHPDRATLRTKFLSEHRHAEDEVRFFVAGSGTFFLREAGKVHQVLCEAGDFLSVPAGIRHWFDMGPAPRFAAVRLFTNPAGWVAHFTGDAIADGFPRHEGGP